MPCFLFVVDPEARIHHLNASALTFIKGGGGDVPGGAGCEILPCIHSRDLRKGCMAGHAPPCAGCAIRDCIGRSLNGEHIFRKAAKMALRAGSRTREADFLITAAPFRYMARAYTVLCLEDVTTEKRMEEEQRKTRDLEVIGSLACGIASDFNNLMQWVFGRISLAKTELHREAAAFAHLDQAEKAIDMSVRLTNQLLAFSKDQTVKQRPDYLSESVEAQELMPHLD